jgi:catechol 2,3-dioxygenase-like lactoylglutathione lyase family enzyme
LLVAGTQPATQTRSDEIMTKVIFGNHLALVVPRTEQDRFRQFYRDVLGCTLTRETGEKDDFRMGSNFYLGVLYEDEGVALDKSDFLKATYLELKADNVEEMRRKIVAFGVKVLEMQDPHLYFQAPGGQVFRLVGSSEDLSKYEGTTDHRELPGEVYG